MSKDEALYDDVKEIISSGSKTPLIDIYDAYLWAKRVKEVNDQARDPNYIHASEIPYCMRHVVIAMLGLNGLGDRKEMGRTLRIFDHGHAFHKRLQTALKSAGVLKNAEQFVSNDEYMIGGSIDGVVNVGYGPEILELKSINSFQFAKAELPLDKHRQQVSVYMFCKDIHKTRFLYEGKNDQDQGEMVYALDFGVLSTVLQKSVVVWKYVKECRAALEAAGLKHGFGACEQGVDLIKPVIGKALPLQTCVMPGQREAQFCMSRAACFALGALMK